MSNNTEKAGISQIMLKQHNDGYLSQQIFADYKTSEE